MGLFSGASSLFTGVKSLFGGQRPGLFTAQPAAPQRPQLFTGQPAGNTAGDAFEGEFVALKQPAGMPPIYFSAGLANTSAKAYMARWDEAYKRSRVDALAMRLDAGMTALLNERKLPCSQMPWHLEPDDKADKEQQATADFLRAALDNIPNLEDLIFALQDAVWYGRSGVQLVWNRVPVSGKLATTVTDWFPVNGDSIQFQWDSTPLLNLYGGVIAGKDDLPADILPEDVIFTDKSRALRLARPYWRERFIIAQQEREAADFYDPQGAGTIEGVGVRHRCYWVWNCMKELEAMMLDGIERFAYGFTVYYYDPSDARAQEKAISIAKDQGRHTWVVWPRSPGDNGATKGIEHVQANGASVGEQLQRLLMHYLTLIEREIVGQSMSGGADNESGLGGSGRAMLAKDTKHYLIRGDCLKRQGELTRDLVAVLQRYNRPEAKYHIRFKFDIDASDPKAKLDAGKAIWEMGVELDEDELRSMAGFEKPAEDAKIIKKQDAGAPPGQGADPMAAALGEEATGNDSPMGQVLSGEAPEADAADDESEPVEPDKQEEEHKKPVRYEWTKDGMFHGPNPPGPGWTQAGTGPKGGKLWKNTGQGKGQQGAGGKPDPDAKKKVAGAASAAKKAAADPNHAVNRLKKSIRSVKSGNTAISTAVGQFNAKDHAQFADLHKQLAAGYKASGDQEKADAHSKAAAYHQGQGKSGVKERDSSTYRDKNSSLSADARPPVNAQEDSALREYAGDGYHAVNATLRGKGHDELLAPEIKEEAKAIHKDLQAAFAKTKDFAKPVEAYRGMMFLGMPDKGRSLIAGIEQAAKSGKAMQFAGYTSTTTNKEIAENDFAGDLLFKIKAKRGIDMKSFSGEPQEDELLLNHNSQFRVSGFRQEGKRYIAELEHL